MIAIELQVGLHEDGIKLMFAPLGKPEAEKETDWVEAEIKFAVTNVVIESPTITVPP